MIKIYTKKMQQELDRKFKEVNQKNCSLEWEKRKTEETLRREKRELEEALNSKIETLELQVRELNTVLVEHEIEKAKQEAGL